MPSPRSVRSPRDRRYTVAPEYCGLAGRCFVARFCGDWLGRSATHTGAAGIARAHAALERARRSLAQAQAELDLAVSRGRES
ncbi:hypothetical protein [Edaphosphingomonas haloaromaticamans]|uniref:Uncharacterized protein n=1 Tax=Edaphosphingomonas haloaromaticamans TaxID=653954 RepID=A0A1S1HH51_9SPHN|nr:hypothetical protein [Sphingomonas haloaromaticamans]OHT21619.1 hypothetical protein BHE75_03630 [Sphingomonas haloaromaticamans]